MSETKRAPVEPCPFCDSDMQGCDVQLGTEDREGFPVNIICPDCGACGPWVYARHPHLADAAMREWNRRAAAAPPDDELAPIECELLRWENESIPYCKSIGREERAGGIKFAADGLRWVLARIKERGDAEH